MWPRNFRHDTALNAVSDHLNAHEYLRTSEQASGQTMGVHCDPSQGAHRSVQRGMHVSGGIQAWHGGQTHVGGGGGVGGGGVSGGVVDGGVSSLQRVFTRSPNGAPVISPS